MRIYDARFKYTPSANTDIRDTWKAHGFKPTTEAERKARQKRMHEPPANVTPIETKKRKAQ